MALKEISDRVVWEELLQRDAWHQFLQSWDWGESQRSLGHEVKRCAYYSEKQPSQPFLVCQLIRYVRRFSSYWFAPRGPIFLSEDLENLQVEFKSFIRDLEDTLPTQGHVLFYRFEPKHELRAGESIFPQRMRRQVALNPAVTRIVDLSLTEDELMAGLHQKTRYNMRLAEKHGVQIREGRGEEDLNTFFVLLRQTAERDAFVSQPESYLRSCYEFLAPKKMIRLRLAEKDGEALAANMEVWYGDTVTYLHGASRSDQRQLMAPYLLQWEAIRAAKASGQKYYDLWGCNPERPSSFYYKPSWEGISRFKRGWGGRIIELVGTWDYPLNSWLYAMVFPKSLAR